LVLLTGTAFSSGDAPGAIGIAGDKRGSDLSFGFGKTVSPPACGCPDLVFTGLFKTRGLGYVYSTEFAEAVHAVADGTSTYSPPEIPAEWRTAAAEWRVYLAAHPGGDAERMNPTTFFNPQMGLDVEPFLSKEACSPALLYLASLEYRSKPGHQGVTPVFPRIVRTAVFDLGSQIVAKSRMAPTYAKRAATILTRITEAERMGAGQCEPSELVRAKSELDRARRAAAGVRSDVRETDASFARAQQVADALLTKRQFAFQKGFKCFPE